MADSENDVVLADNGAAQAIVDDGNDERPNFLDQGEGRDWMLAWIIGHAEVFGVEFGVTLSVGGSLIAGTVIGGRKYLEQLADDVRKATGTTQDFAEQLGNNFSQWSGLYPEPNGGTSILELKPAYIHLKDARVIQSNGNHLPRNGMLWRGKVKSVDGFTLGHMQPD